MFLILIAFLASQRHFVDAAPVVVRSFSSKIPFDVGGSSIRRLLRPIAASVDQGPLLQDKRKQDKSGLSCSVGSIPVPWTKETRETLVQRKKEAPSISSSYHQHQTKKHIDSPHLKIPFSIESSPEKSCFASRVFCNSLQDLCHKLNSTIHKIGLYLSNTLYIPKKINIQVVAFYGDGVCASSISRLIIGELEVSGQATKEKFVYPTSLAKQYFGMTPSKPLDASLDTWADITISIDPKCHFWVDEGDGKPDTSNKESLERVLLHQIIHGLGFDSGLYRATARIDSTDKAFIHPRIGRYQYMHKLTNEHFWYPKNVFESHLVDQNGMDVSRGMDEIRESVEIDLILSNTDLLKEALERIQVSSPQRAWFKTLDGQLIEMDCIENGRIAPFSHLSDSFGGTQDSLMTSLSLNGQLDAMIGPKTLLVLQTLGWELRAKRRKSAVFKPSTYPWLP